MINIGLVGFGYWGPNVAKNIFNNEKFNFVTICDYDESRLKKAQSIYIEQVNYETDFTKLLEDDDIEAIAIAVETSSHFKLAKAVLLAGKHVYVEKPFTSTVEEAIELKELSERLGLIIHVDHIMMFHPIIKVIHTLIESGDLGDILYIDAVRMNLGQIKKDVSAMWDLAIHDLAIIDYLSNGQTPHYISAVGEKIYNPKESLVFLNLRYDNFMAHVQSSWISPLKERKLIVAGTKKMVVFDDMKASEKLMIYDKGVNVISGDNVEYDDYAIKIREGDILIPYIPREDALYNSLEHFANCLIERKPSVSNPTQAIRLMNMLEKADEKMNK